MFQIYNLITWNVHTDTCAKKKTNERRAIVSFTLSELKSWIKKLKELYQEQNKKHRA